MTVYFMIKSLQGNLFKKFRYLIMVVIPARKQLYSINFWYHSEILPQECVEVTLGTVDKFQRLKEVFVV